MFFMDHHLRLNEHENCCGLIKVARFFLVYIVCYILLIVSSVTSRRGLEMFGKKPKTNPRHYKVSLKCTTHSDLQFPKSLTSTKKKKHTTLYYRIFYCKCCVFLFIYFLCFVNHDLQKLKPMLWTFIISREVVDNGG